MSDFTAKVNGIAVQVHYHTGRDVWWHEEEAKVSDVCEPEWMDAEDPLFILYTRS